MTMDVLAKRLRGLAGDARIAPRAGELRALADDLEHGTRLDQWAEVDLVYSFVRPESLAAAPAGQRPGRLRSLIAFLRSTGPGNSSLPAVARWLRGGLRQQPVREGALEAVMGVLVFVPLLVTWVGLREAVGAYGELSRDDPKESTRPFLQLWQSGFGGHLSAVGRFENVALTTVLFIVLLVLLAIWNARARSRSDREEEQNRGADERLLGTLASLLTQAQFALVPHRGATPQQFGRELSNAAKRLGALAARAENSHKALTTTGALMKQATDDLQAATRGLTAEIPKLGGVAGRLELAVRDGQEAIVRAGKDNALAAQGISDRIEAAGSTVESALGTLAAAQQTLVEKSEVVAQTSERAAQALLASTAGTNDAVEGMREATERWDAVAAHWQDAASRIDSGLRVLAGNRSPVPSGWDDGGWHTPTIGDRHALTVEDRYGPPADRYGPPADSYGPLVGVPGPSVDAPGSSAGAPASSVGAPGQSAGAPGQSAGAASPSAGAPGPSLGAAPGYVSPPPPDHAPLIAPEAGPGGAHP